ncbi:MAG: sodium:proton antiporter [Promicromonosporaceae bacterium]|nr:sodium:proton antiporter [Promicromonosporaceae bacterium]
MELLTIAVLAVLLVVFVETVAPKLGVAGPLILVALGILVSLIPAVPEFHIEPEVVLGGILPPLLYSAAVKTPTMEFRRDLRTIGFFAAPLVIASAVAIGVFLHWIIPGLPLGIGIAVGAVVSPTDAVATGIVKNSGASTRVLSVLEGEALLNDATALVLLRSALATVAAGFSFWQVSADFLWAVAVAVGIGVMVGKANVAIRERIPNIAGNVAFSLAVPFVASIPAEHLRGSGLVAAVVAGLITGYSLPRRIPSQTRITSFAVWNTVNLLLESAVFLMMGLMLRTLIDDVLASTDQVPNAVWLGVAAVNIVIAIRAIFVATALVYLHRRGMAIRRRHARFREFRQKVEAAGVGISTTTQRGRPPGPSRWERLHRLVERRASDLDYLAGEHFDAKDGAVLVWAGMRGTITVAAALSLPTGTPHRSLLILIAYFVAAGTLLVQGATLPALIRMLRMRPRPLAGLASQLADVRSQLGSAALAALDERAWVHSDGTPYSPEAIEASRATVDLGVRLAHDDPSTLVHREERQLRLEVVNLERQELLRIRDRGLYPTEVIGMALSLLDAEQISIESQYLDMRLRFGEEA